MASHRRTVAAACAVILASISLYPIFIGTALVLGRVRRRSSSWRSAGTATRLRRLPVAGRRCSRRRRAAPLPQPRVRRTPGRCTTCCPRPASLAALWHTAGQGFSEASQYAPPVPELRGMVLLAAAGIGIAALLTDLIAVRLGSAALAGLPLLLLFTEPFTLSVSRGFVGTTVAFCVGVAGYLALLSSEGRDRIREWEQPDPSARDAPDTRPLAAAGTAGRRSPRSCSRSACRCSSPGCTPPGCSAGSRGSAARRRGAAAAPGRVGFPDPNAQLSQELHAAQASTVLAYTTTDPSPDYLQIYALDKLTDTRLAAVRPARVAGPGQPAAARAARAHRHRVAGQPETTTITIARDVGADDLDALPVPYPATTVTANGTLRGGPVHAHGVRLRRLPRRPDLHGHQPRRVAGRPAARRRAAAARGHHVALPVGALLLRLAAGRWRSPSCGRRGREDPVRGGRRAAELAGRRVVQVHAERADGARRRAA